MDVSILASVGSFVVSERVLKPKASVLVILGCFLAYDLTTKTHDSSSLRVYRGPALIAFTLCMTAFSLRTWRRNGVACDELIFLPGTPHGQRHGADGNNQPMNNNTNHGTTPNVNTAGDTPERLSNENGVGVVSSSTNSSPGRNRSGEADIAAGVASVSSISSISNVTTLAQPPAVEMCIIRSSKDSLGGSRARSLSRDNPLDGPDASSSHDFAYKWDEEGRDDSGTMDEGCGDLDDGNDCDEKVALATTVQHSTSCASPHNRSGSKCNSSFNNNSNELSSTDNDSNATQSFPEARPRITRFGSFFFFRSNATSTQNAAYAPSGPSVVGAAIDLSIPTLFNFHLFIEQYNHIDQNGSETPAKILPLIFLSVLIVRTAIPPGRRGRFWSVMKYTFMAPFHHVRFRDAFMGDILTSLVRPLQDILFALSYYITVIWGTASGNLTLSESGDALESSWLLHNVVLPSCALLPLWWKFLQTLRQSYDSGKRWPHLGNAFKYLSAALVILYGMTHPENRRSSLWIVMFAACLMYQTWWDVVMDWDLLMIVPRGDETVNWESVWCSSRSFRANSYVLYLNMLIVQPLRDGTRWAFARIPRLSQIQLRQRRLYKEQSFYWRILAYNIIFRFCWMLCFIPAYRLSPSGREHVTTFSSDTNSYVGVLLPLTEILRRTFWGFLFLEKETLKMQDEDPSYSRLSDTSHGEGREDEEAALLAAGGLSEVNDDNSDDSKQRGLPAWLGSSTQQQHIPQDVNRGRLASIQEYLTFSDDVIHNIFIVELSMWAAAFVGFGLWATT